MSGPTGLIEREKWADFLPPGNAWNVNPTNGNVNANNQTNNNAVWCVRP